MEAKFIISKKDPKSPVAEAYRTLRTNIQFSNIDKSIKSIVVTSAGPAEGKSTVAANLAVTMAQNNKKVLVLDCDLRKPKMHKIFNVINMKGLTTVLAEGIDYREVTEKISEVANLEIMTTGPIPPNPAELLGSTKMKEFLKIVEEDYDVVIIDSPPVGMVTDAAILSTIADGIILVCAVGQAIIDVTRNAITLLQNVNANIMGVVLNKIPVNKGGYYKYHYYNYYYASEK